MLSKQYLNLETLFNFIAVVGVELAVIIALFTILLGVRRGVTQHANFFKFLIFWLVICLVFSVANSAATLIDINKVFLFITAIVVVLGFACYAGGLLSAYYYAIFVVGVFILWYSATYVGIFDG